MNEKEILEEVLESLIRIYRSIEKKLSLYEENDSKYNTLLNSQMKVSRSIQNCVSLLRDPKRQILSGKRGRTELAKMIEAVEGTDKEPQKISLMTYKEYSPRKKRFEIVKGPH